MATSNVTWVAMSTLTLALAYLMHQLRLSRRKIREKARLLARKRWRVLRDVSLVVFQPKRKHCWRRSVPRILARCLNPKPKLPAREVLPLAEREEPSSAARAEEQMFAQWVGSWEQDHLETEALMAYMRSSKTPWLAAQIIVRTNFTVDYYFDPVDHTLCSAVKVAGILLVRSKYAHGTQNVLELPLPGFPIRNTTSFSIVGDTIHTHGEIRIIDGAVLSSNLTVMRRDEQTDEIEVKTIDELHGTYSRFLRRMRPKAQ